MDNTLINKCLLCFKHDENLINILKDDDHKPSISQILSQHFWLEMENIPSNYICQTCWDVVENFHKFYEKTLEAHRAFYSKIPTSDLVAEKQEIFALIDNEKIKSENEDCGKTDMIEEPNNEECDSSQGIKIKKRKSTRLNFTKMKKEENSTKIEASDLVSEKEETFALIDNEKIKSESEDCDNTDMIEEPNNEEYDSSQGVKIKKRKSTRLNLTKMKKEKDSTKIENEDDEIRKYCNMECELCGTKFDVFQNAKTHYRTKHSINGYLSCCGRKFRKRCHVLEHLHWHLNPNDFTCEICNRKYADKRGLKIHQLTHLPMNMKPFKCPKCPQSFGKNFLLRQHQVKHITNEEKQFFCDDCGKAFATKCLLQFHKRGAHEGAFTHVCEICATSFKSRLLYRNHMKNVHSTSDKPRVQCDLCSAWLKHEHSLRKHMARHEDSNKTYICNICGKQSPNRGALKSHQDYVHASKRNHKCNVCDKAFKKAVGLKEHMAIHTGEVLYNCPHCPRTFNSSANMHSHRKKFHTKEWEENRRNKIMEYNQGLNNPSLEITE